jgi:type VI secretion system protein VasG
MADITVPQLFGKMTSIGHSAMDAAFGYCLRQHRPYIELQHWLWKVLELPDSDLHRILKHFGVSRDDWEQDLQGKLAEKKLGSASSPELSLQMWEAAEAAWKYASLLFGASQIRTAMLSSACSLIKTCGGNSSHSRKHSTSWISTN